MKISGSHVISVNIPALKELGSLLKNVNPGDIVQASIIKSEGNKALLDLGGRIITAEFTNGVPGDKLIDLVLTSKSSDKIQFSLKENDPSGSLYKFLSSFSILKDDELKNSSLQNLARFINTVKPDMAEINMFLLGIKKDERKEKNISSFFNRLIMKGVPFQTLIDLSYLIYSKYNPVLFMSYQYMLNLSGKKSFNQQKESSSFEDRADFLCGVLKEDEADFSLMLDLIFDETKNRDIYGELPFPNEESFSRIDYIIHRDSVFFKFELSAAGTLGVFVRAEKESVTINFLSARDEVLLFLKEKDGYLKRLLEENGIKKSMIGYFDSKKIVDKLELWSLDFYTKSGFNVTA